ncbi:ethylene-responsive transcription factor RAP2-2-like [Magnolia sinica]|uniref:ethylene-responsive transcription factor RAP2-2-like n=1 Tax=Magnolia sinica TaxID=86752 RepID=UPI00265A9CBF|nr:ethylene-responsive transcription factor RAP2-2-like [Magnolia sinica]
MCRRSIMSDFIPRSRSRPLTDDYLKPVLKKGVGNYYSKPLKSKMVGLEDDFEADFQNFRDDSDEEDEVEDVKPFSFPKLDFSREYSIRAKSVEYSGPAEKSAKRKRKNQFRGIQQCPWGKWAGKIRDPRKGVTLWLGTFNIAEEAASAYDAEARRIRGKKAKANFPEEPSTVALKRPVKPSSQKALKSGKPTCNQYFNFINSLDHDFYNTLGFINEESSVKPSGYLSSFPMNGNPVEFNSVMPSDGGCLCFNSDQGSNSFDSSDFGSEQEPKSPETSSILATKPESDGSEFIEDANLRKRLKNSSKNAMPVEEDMTME